MASNLNAKVLHREEKWGDIVLKKGHYHVGLALAGIQDPPHEGVLTPSGGKGMGVNGH